MALTSLQRLRLRVADRPRAVLSETLGIADGVLVAFQAQLAPLVTGSLMVQTVSAAGVVVPVDPVNYTADLDLGTITFTTAPISGLRVNASYQWTVFSDAELNDVLALQPDLRLATITVLEVLLADTERFTKYTIGQEAVDRSQAYRSLLALLENLQKQPTRGNASGIVLADTAEKKANVGPWCES